MKRKQMAKLSIYENPKLKEYSEKDNNYHDYNKTTKLTFTMLNKQKQIKFKPIGPYILVEPYKEEENKTKSGIILTDPSLADRTKSGLILKLGTGTQLPNGGRTEFNVKEGETVQYKDFAGYPVKVDDKEYVLLLESDILGVI